jgi:hypothetical protein
MVIGVSWGVTLFVLWLVGMWGFTRAAREAGVRWTGPLSAMQIYRHAFQKMRGSGAMWAIVGGFGGMLVLVIVGLLFGERLFQ